MFGRRRDRSGPDRRGTPADWLVVGLGNPGEEYARTRHNVGAEVVEMLAGRHGVDLRRTRERARGGEGMIEGCRVALAVPLTYMNLSGEAVRPLVRRHGIEDPARLIVVHDELDLPVGTLRVKAGGGLAGHNGLRSIEAHLRTRDFLRVRLGVGKPPRPEAGSDHVLRRPTAAVRRELDVVVEEAADAVEVIIAEGVEAAMNRVNRR